MTIAKYVNGKIGTACIQKKGDKYEVILFSPHLPIKKLEYDSDDNLKNIADFELFLYLRG